MIRRGLTWAIAHLLALAAPALGWDDEPPTQTSVKYVRLERDAEGEPVGLQTAIVHFASTDPAQGELTVDLVAAVHLGDKTYYDALNKRFEGYDAVLYELVAPEGTKVPKGAKTTGHPVALLQNGLKDLMQLDHQLECIDYTKDNMVHADMSPDELAKAMKVRGENLLGAMMRMMSKAMSQQKTKSNISDIDLLRAFFDKDRSGMMKRLMAEQFENLEGLMDALGGSSLIAGRNQVVLDKLNGQIAAGKKKIAIFYGAGHMGDIEKQLTADFHLRRAGDEWLTAWKLDNPPVEAKPEIKKPSARISPRRIQVARLGILAHLFSAR